MRNSLARLSKTVSTDMGDLRNKQLPHQCKLKLHLLLGYVCAPRPGWVWYFC